MFCQTRMISPSQSADPEADTASAGRALGGDAIASGNICMSLLFVALAGLLPAAIG